VKVKKNAPEIYLSPQEIAYLLGVSADTINRWIQDGLFHRTERQINGNRVITYVLLDELVEKARHTFEASKMTYQYAYPNIWLRGNILQALCKFKDLLGSNTSVEWGSIAGIQRLKELANSTLKNLLIDLKRLETEGKGNTQKAKTLRGKLEAIKDVLSALDYYIQTRKPPADIPIITLSSLVRLLKSEYPDSIGSLSNKIIAMRILQSKGVITFNFGDNKIRFVPVWSVLYVMRYVSNLFSTVGDREESFTEVSIDDETYG